MLDIVPAQLQVKVIRRPRYACRACEEAVVQAPAPRRPITGRMATSPCWLMCWWPSMPTFCLAARPRSSPGKGSSSTARPYATG